MVTRTRVATSIGLVAVIAGITVVGQTVSTSKSSSPKYAHPTVNAWQWLEQPKLSYSEFSALKSPEGCVKDDTTICVQPKRELAEDEITSNHRLIKHIYDTTDRLIAQGKIGRNIDAIVDEQRHIIPDSSTTLGDIVEYYNGAIAFAQTHPQLSTLNFDFAGPPIIITDVNQTPQQPDNRIIIARSQLNEYTVTIKDGDPNNTRNFCFVDYVLGSKMHFEYENKTGKPLSRHIFLSTDNPELAVMMPFSELIPYGLINELTADCAQRGNVAATRTMEALSESISYELAKDYAAQLNIPESEQKVDRAMTHITQYGNQYTLVPFAKQWLADHSIEEAVALYRADPLLYERTIVMHTPDNQ